jgi:hypothetical protein
MGIRGSLRSSFVDRSYAYAKGECRVIYFIDAAPASGSVTPAVRRIRGRNEWQVPDTGQ